jgi:hypothetical protein
MDTEEQAWMKIEAIQTALTIAVGALIKTHPDPTQLHLTLTSLLEQQLGNGALGALLSAEQKATTRDVVEWLGTLHSSPGRTASAP